MRGVSLLLVLLASSAGIGAESTESLKIADNSSTVKSDSTNSATQRVQVSSLEGASNDASNNTHTTSSLEQKPVETTLRNVTSGENGIDSVITSSLLPKENVVETPERNIQSDSPQENAVGETNTGTDTNLESSGDVPTQLPALVSNSTFTSVKSPVTPTDSENATISNVISPLTTVTINRNDNSSGTFENKTVPGKDVPNSLTTAPDTFNVSSANETIELTNSDAQQNPGVTNLTRLTNGTEEASPDNSTHSNNEIQTFDLPDGGNTTSTEYPATTSFANTTSENETISTLTISNSTETATTSVESSENSTITASTTSLNETDNSESAVDRNTTLSSNTTDHPNRTVTSNYTDSTNETAGSTTTSLQEIATVTYSPSDNDTMSSIPTPPSMETTASYPQNSTLVEPTTPVSITNDTEVSDNTTDPTSSYMTTISSTHAPTSEIPYNSTTDGMEKTTYPLSTTAGSETTVSSNSSSESTATSSTTSSDPATEDLSSDVPSTDSDNTTTVEVTTSVESSEDTTSTEHTTDTISLESSTEETSSVIASTTEAQTSDMPGSSSTTHYTASTMEFTTLPTTIAKPPTTRTTTATSQISTTTENTSNNLGPPLNYFSVTDKNGVSCIIFRVRLELLISYVTNSGAISDERLNVPSVDKFEGACGFVEQYISAAWSIPTGGTNNISFSMEKSIDNSSYTLKVIRVSLVLDKVNFPDAEHQGVTLSEEIAPNFYSIPSGRGLKCTTRKSFVGTNVTMIASDVELLAFNEQQDLSALQYGGCPLAAAPTLQTEEIAAIAVGAVLALITASLATALVFRKRRTRTNKFYLTGNTWA